MSEKYASSDFLEGAGLYEIRLKGQVTNRWVDWLGEVAITLEANGNTLLTCQVVDQAALHGLLKRVRDMGLSLISINFVNPRQDHKEEVYP